MGRPRKIPEEDSTITLHSKWWIWDDVWEEPREVEIVRRQVNEHGEFLCFDSYETVARGSKGHRFLHQIHNKSQLFKTKADLCDHYIKMFTKFKNKGNDQSR